MRGARLIVTDGVFSMDGYLAPLADICDLAEKYDAMVMVDDSHAVGFVGPTGAGTPELAGVQDRVDIVSGTLGKALGGASGGYISRARRDRRAAAAALASVPVLQRGRAVGRGRLAGRARPRRRRRTTHARDAARATPRCSGGGWPRRASTCCPASTRSVR